MPDLRGKIAVVTGASRGAGRGIARVLGEAGAVVYVTGRSLRGLPTTDHAPGTIEDTAEEVTARGGRGISVRCDHTVEDEVSALFAHILAEQGGLDLLVNNAWGGNEHSHGGVYPDGSHWGIPFWERSLRPWHSMFEAGVRAHLMASRYAVPLLLNRPGGMIACTTFWDHQRYLGDLYYDLAKASINRLAFAMAQDLRPHGITSVAISPGFMRTERVLAEGSDLSQTESTEYVGRAIAALAADPHRLARTGQVLTVAKLAREYGFTDIDGRRPEAFRVPDADLTPPSSQGA